MILEGREAGNDLALDAKAGTLYEITCSASGTISRIVRRNASSVLRLAPRSLGGTRQRLRRTILTSV